MLKIFEQQEIYVIKHGSKYMKKTLKNVSQYFFKRSNGFLRK